jgi:hypothetical protein
MAEGDLKGVKEVSGSYTEVNLRSELLSNVVDDTTPQLGGELDCQAHSVGFTQQSSTGVVGTTNIDWRLGNDYYFTFGNGNETLTFTNPSKACHLTLVVKQYSTGGKTMTWPTILWAGATPPTLSTGNNAVDIISFYWNGTSYYGLYSLNFA